MKKIIISIIFSISFLNSCQPSNDKVRFRIQNHSEKSFDSIYVTNFHTKDSSAKLFAPYDSINLEIDFKNVKHNGDGSYGIVAYNQNDSIYYHFGYYTNGIPIAKGYILQILNDTIQIQEIR